MTAGPQTVTRGWREAWTPRRIRLWLAMALIAAWLPVIGVPLRKFLDFSAFYVAAQFAFTPDVVRLEPIILAQAAAGLPIAPFLYPPLFALLYVPLTWLPFELAGFINLALMFAALILAALLGARLYGLPRGVAVLGALAWGPAAASVLGGQNVTLALLLLVIAGLELARHESAGSRLAGLLAGIAISALAYKPQFAAPPAGLAVLRGRWLLIATVALSICLQYLLSVPVAGGNFAWPLDWLAVLSRYSAVDLATNGWQAISLPALLARIQIGPFDASGAAGLQGLSLLGYALGAAVIVGCVPAMRRLPAPRALALAVGLGLLVTPHAWVHNATLLLPALAALAADAAGRGWTWRDRWLFAAIYAAGLAWPLGGLLGFTFLPIVVIAMPALLLAWKRSFRVRSPISGEPTMGGEAP